MPKKTFAISTTAMLGIHAKCSECGEIEKFAPREFTPWLSIAGRIKMTNDWMKKEHKCKAEG